MKHFTILFLIFMLSSRTQSGYKKFYTGYYNYDELKDATDIEWLKAEEEPKIYSTDDFDRDRLVLESQMYNPLGYSSFNGAYEDQENIIEQAKRIRATLILVNAKYTNTESNSVILSFPTTNTSYHSGTVYSGGQSASYSGTSTSYGESYSSTTIHNRRYDQSAEYYVKVNRKYKIGVITEALTYEERSRYQRNTGVVIRNVLENSPAFDANIIPGDMLIAVDGKLILNVNDFMDIAEKIDNITTTVFKIMRNKKVLEIEIEINFNSH